MKNYILGFSILVLLQGCSTKVFNNTIEVATTLKEYNHFTKDEVLNAAKRVFRITDKDKFVIDSYRDKIEVSKIKANYEVLGLELYEDKFKLEVKDSNKSVVAFLSLKRVVGLKQDEEKYFGSDIHQFFWERINYILGIRKTWPKCIQRYVDFNLVLNNVLCDPVELENKEANREDKIVSKENIEDSQNIFDVPTQNGKKVTKKEIETIVSNGEKLLIGIKNKENKIQIKEDMELELTPVVKKEIEVIEKDKVLIEKKNIETIINNGKKLLRDIKNKENKIEVKKDIELELIPVIKNEIEVIEKDKVLIEKKNIETPNIFEERKELVKNETIELELLPTNESKSIDVPKKPEVTKQDISMMISNGKKYLTTLDITKEQIPNKSIFEEKILEDDAGIDIITIKAELIEE